METKQIVMVYVTFLSIADNDTRVVNLDILKENNIAILPDSPDYKHYKDACYLDSHIWDRATALTMAQVDDFEELPSTWFLFLDCKEDNCNFLEFMDYLYRLIGDWGLLAHVDNYGYRTIKVYDRDLHTGVPFNS